jgi:hypothetical protein
MMEIHCEACGQVIKIKQYQPYHSGFSNRGFLYCDSHSAILEFDSYNPNYIKIVGDKHPWSLNRDEKKRVENALKPFSKGGNFRFSALPRCPICNAELHGLLKDNIHFVEIGEIIDADKEDVWV